MNIIAIRQTSSGQNVHFISEDFSEYSLSDLIFFAANKIFDNIKLLTTKSGNKTVRVKANHSKKDNFDRISITCNAGDYLLFDRQFLKLVSRNGRIKKQWIAFSGTPESTVAEQDRADYGPLPEGEYYVLFSDTLDTNDSSLWDSIKWVRKSPAWGFIATPLQQVKGDAFNRGHFYIHGGLFKGTKGCIEVNGFDNSRFHAFMRLYNRNFKLIVRYPQK
jgi:hypothetical protein